MPGGSVNGRPFRESSDSYQRTGIPCGNPKRFRSHEVVRMEPGRRTASGRIDGPVEEIETAGQKHLQSLLQKQLDNKIPLQQYIHQKKEFSRGAEYNPVSKETAGMVTLDEFKVLEQTDGYIEEMKACGLTMEEILYKFQTEDSQLDNRKSKFTNADHEKNKLKEIDRKIEKKKSELEKPDTFSNVMKLSRHDMDLERTLSSANHTNAFLHKVLIQERDKTHESNKQIMSQLPEVLGKVPSVEVANVLPKSKSRRKRKHERYKSECTLECCARNTCTNCNSFSCCCGLDDSHVELNCDPTELSSIPTCAEKPEGFVSNYDHEITRDEKQKERKCEKKDKRPSSFCISKYNKGSSEYLPDRKFHESSRHQVETWNNNDQSNKTKTEYRDSDDISSSSLSESPEVRTLSDVEGIPDAVILQYKLSLEQIKQIPRFENYSPGEPSNILFVKNLSPKLTETELAALFINFQKSDTEKIIFKLLTGRMKGQAFVTFADIKTASEALQLVHGYEYKGKPVIVQYGKRNTL